MKTHALISIAAVVLGSLAQADMPAKTSKVMGTPIAAITIDVYSDFQCPHCKALHETWMEPLIRNYVLTGKVQLIQHEFPLQQHPYARTAANYAAAADRVGKYGEVCDILFKKQDDWGKDGKVDQTVCSVLNAAEAKKVRELAKDPAILAQVQKDIDSGMAARLQRTPTVIVSYKGKHYNADVGATYASFARFLDSLAH
jgi:protein-disulfide isomerase